MVVVAQLVELWFVEPAVTGSSPRDHPKNSMNNEEKFSIVKRAKSFTHAGPGLFIFLKTTHNAWVHVAILILAVVAGAYFRITLHEWMILIFAAGFVLTAE